MNIEWYFVLFLWFHFLHDVFLIFFSYNIILDLNFRVLFDKGSMIKIHTFVWRNYSEHNWSIVLSLRYNRTTLVFGHSFIQNPLNLILLIHVQMFLSKYLPYTKAQNYIFIDVNIFTCYHFNYWIPIWNIMSWWLINKYKKHVSF